jgi:hypothetical protein
MRLQIQSTIGSITPKIRLANPRCVSKVTTTLTSSKRTTHALPLAPEGVPVFQIFLLDGYDLDLSGIL